MKNRSKVLHCKNFDWEGVQRKHYKQDASCYKNIHRYSLLGEGELDFELNFQTRYFEIEPEGYSSAEMHRHPHSVIIIRGKGSVVLGDEVHDLALHDVVYISPETLHQFHADKGDYLGFVCVVDRYRDRPSLPNDADLAALPPDSPARQKIKR